MRFILGFLSGLLASEDRDALSTQRRPL